MSDFKVCAKQLEKDDSQFVRRTLFRTAFSMFEAVNSLIASRAIEAQMARIVECRYQISITDLILLTEREPKIAENGDVRNVRAKHSFLNFSAFVLKAFARCTGVTKRRLLAGKGWQDFRASVAVRNRITHPKTKREMIVSDRELNALVEAAQWYMRTCYDIAERSKVFSSSLKAMKSERRRSR